MTPTLLLLALLALVLVRRQPPAVPELVLRRRHYERAWRRRLGRMERLVGRE